MGLIIVLQSSILIFGNVILVGFHVLLVIVMNSNYTEMRKIYEPCEKLEWKVKVVDL